MINDFFQQVPRLYITSEMLVNNLKTKEEKEMAQTKDRIVLDGVEYVREDFFRQAKELGMDVVAVRTDDYSQYVGILEKIDGDTVYLQNVFGVSYFPDEKEMAFACGLLVDTSGYYKTFLNQKLIVSNFSTIHYMTEDGYKMAKSFRLIGNK